MHFIFILFQEVELVVVLHY